MQQEVSSNSHQVLCLIGTRPEAIKMAPVVLALDQHPKFSPKIVLSGQHSNLTKDALHLFGLVNYIQLNPHLQNHSLATQAATYLQATSTAIEQLEPGYMLVHGDTTTGLAGALAAFYARIKVAHVEAGLRSGDLDNPFPEEANRLLIDRLCDKLFAPTHHSASLLLREGVSSDKIIVTGNTVVDALRLISSNLEAAHFLPQLKGQLPKNRPFILVTTHRRENWGRPMHQICKAIKELLLENPSYFVVLPVHPNPNVQQVILPELTNVDRVILTEPLDYTALIALQKDADFIMTDSGGLQEEAPTFSTPVLVLRHTTERPEAIEAGCSRLVGVNTEAIKAGAQETIDKKNKDQTMVNPFGDGHAAERIVRTIAQSI
ncbi:non-hydrolyzing UDP-N-acetylglucosamine 2-epimerase [Flexibacterium corallicola]|uniref:non-hydrolyzing UDP-N-acetylglucosamine 2-epimerase n=1 Tax=Flexibacterium corallicola TaxID=3037259 RepID=UPI00286F736D|nr:UDP-N-acetylglucosamine 2-epimerase (non-hydrolyzing) [Pseudovibrio sp. M1P-2-3]